MCHTFRRTAKHLDDATFLSIKICTVSLAAGRSFTQQRPTKTKQNKSKQNPQTRNNSSDLFLDFLLEMWFIKCPIQEVCAYMHCARHWGGCWDTEMSKAKSLQNKFLPSHNDLFFFFPKLFAANYFLWKGEREIVEIWGCLPQNILFVVVVVRVFFFSRIFLHEYKFVGFT